MRGARIRSTAGPGLAWGRATSPAQPALSNPEPLVAPAGALQMLAARSTMDWAARNYKEIVMATGKQVGWCSASLGGGAQASAQRKTWGAGPSPLEPQFPHEGKRPCLCLGGTRQAWMSRQQPGGGTSAELWFCRGQVSPLCASVSLSAEWEYVNHLPLKLLHPVPPVAPLLAPVLAPPSF